VDILERIRKLEAKDDEVIKAVEKMKKAGVKMLRDEKYIINCSFHQVYFYYSFPFTFFFYS